MARRYSNAITDVPGIRVGHAHDAEALTGVTVVLCDGPDGSGAAGGVDQRGGAPGTRQTDALQPMHLVQKVHAVVLSGGSAFGLDSATGVMKFLEEKGVGFDVRVAKVPIVPTAILFDLGLGRSDVRPDAAMGYAACQNAGGGPVAEGCAGAGMGATVGKILGMGQAMKGGLGTASIPLGRGVVVGAIVAVNAFGDVIDPASGRIVAGARRRKPGQGRPGDPGYFADTLAVMKARAGRGLPQFGRQRALAAGRGGNTVIGVVAVNADLTKEEANKVAQMAHDGLARCVRPAHTMVDGDTLFALATGGKQVDVNIVGAFAAEAVAQAILRAVRQAAPLGGLPAAGEG
jgi:L-aminopeptidase/D-esterase-like protein